RRPGARRAGQTLALAGADRLARRVQAPPRLDLHEGDRSASLDDEVDLAPGRRVAAREGAVALQHQDRERDPLGPAPPAVGGAAASASMSGRRWGDSNSMSVAGTFASAASRARRAALLGGRKPSKKKRSVGNPETTSAVRIAEGPGIGVTGTPSWMAACTSL